MANQKIGSLVLDLRARLDSFKSDMEKASSIMKNEMASIGRNAAMIQLPFAAIGGYAMKAASDFKAAERDIRVSTGATGQSLKELGQVVKDVYANADESMAEIGRAVAQLSQRTGLTGEPLKKLTEMMLDVGKVFGGDITTNIRSTTRLFGDWGISTEKQRESLDKLMKVAQVTGINTGRMMETMVYYGAPLRQLGFTFEQTALMLGKFDKEGVNAEMVIAGLGRALGKFNQMGMSPADGLAAAIKQIKEASDTQANALGRSLVGARPGAAENFVAAIREGRFDLEELNKRLRENKDTLAEAAQASEKFSDKVTKAWHEVELALLPLGGELLKTFKTDLLPIIKDATAMLAKLGQAFSELPDPIKNMAIGVGTLTAALATGAPLLGLWLEKTLGIATAMKTIAGLIGSEALAGMLGIGGLATVAGVGAYVQGSKEMNKRLEDAGMKAGKPGDYGPLKDYVALQNIMDDLYTGKVEPGFKLQLGKNLGQLGNLNLPISQKTGARIPTEEEKAYAAQIDKTVQSILDKNKVTEENVDVMNAAIKAGASLADVEQYLGDRINLGTGYTDKNLKAIQALKIAVYMDKEDVSFFADLTKDAEKSMKATSDLIHAQGINLFGMPIAEKVVPNAQVEGYAKIIESFANRKDDARETASAIGVMVSSGYDLREVYEQYGRLLEDQPELFDKSTRKLLEHGRILSIFRDSWREITSTISGSFGNAMVEAATKGKAAFKDMATSILDSFKSMIKRLLSQLVDDMIRPMMTTIRGYISGALGNASMGGIGGGSLGGGIASMGSIAMSPFGTPYLGMSGSGASGGMGGSSLAASLGSMGTMGAMLGVTGGGMLGGLFGGGGLGKGIGMAAGGIGGAFGGAAAAYGLSGGTMGAGALAPMLSFLMTNPIGWAIMAGLGGLAIGNILYKSPADRAAQETGRDFGGIKMKTSDFTSFASSLGLNKSGYEGIRKDLLSSPKYLTEVAYPLAKQQGKINEFLSSLSNVQTAWGTFDFRSPFETWMKTGSAGALNTAFEKAFAQSQALELNLPDWRTSLDAAGGDSTSTTRVRLNRPITSGSNNSGTVSIPGESGSRDPVNITIINNVVDAQGVDTLTREKVIPSIIDALRMNTGNSRVLINRALEA